MNAPDAFGSRTASAAVAETLASAECRVLVVFGTRPEAIKLAPLILELQASTEFDVITCATAQHRQMLDQVLDLFGIRPDHDLNLMQAQQELGDLTARVLAGIHQVLAKTRPSLCLVHGDTTTTMAASVQCFYDRVPVGHVEAGLRTYRKDAPFPEEMNRQITTRVADFHFAPTSGNRANLLAEGVPEEQIVVTGNTVIDALHLMRDRILSDGRFAADLESSVAAAGYRPNGRQFILVTGHRRENFGDGFLNICRALASIASAHPQVDIVYPVHLNPNVRKPVHALLSALPNVFLLEPVDYASFVYLMMKCHFIITDSGGVQEEGPGLNKPVFVMREVSERPEAIQSGAVKLVGTSVDAIVSEATLLLRDPAAFRSMTGRPNPYGDGRASRRIVEFLKLRAVQSAR